MLPRNGCDQGIPGQFYACHAEKQLIAYFVYRHLILAHEILEEDYGFAGLTLEPTQRRGKGLAELQTVQPPKSLRDGTIFVSRNVCLDCKDFVKKVNDKLDLNLNLQSPNQYV